LNTKKIFNAGLVLVVLVAQGCATTDMDRDLNKKLTQEPTIPNTAVLSKEAQATINDDNQLTPDQKAALTKLHAETTAKLNELREQALQLRNVLLNDFVAENDQEIDVIHDRLKYNYSQRVSVLFGAVAKANKIIGHIPRNRRWVDELMLESHGTRD